MKSLEGLGIEAAASIGHISLLALAIGVYKASKIPKGQMKFELKAIGNQHWVSLRKTPR